MRKSIHFFHCWNHCSFLLSFFKSLEENECELATKETEGVNGFIVIWCRVFKVFYHLWSTKVIFYCRLWASVYLDRWYKRHRACSFSRQTPKTISWFKVNDVFKPALINLYVHILYNASILHGDTSKEQHYGYSGTVWCYRRGIGTNR